MSKYTPDRRLTGGLRLAAHKQDSTADQIKRGLIPTRIILSLHQQRGRAAVPAVSIGQRVLKGELLAHTEGREGHTIHASTSGRVREIASLPVPFATGVVTESCIVIEADGEDQAIDVGGRSPWPEHREAQIEAIREAGIVGLGGALFPTAAKLSALSECRLLIVNGAECEPYISCDDLLMREAAEEIVDGTALLASLVGAAQCVIAIERDKPEAIEAIARAAVNSSIQQLRIAELASIYPAGGERQLVEVLTGLEVPSSGHPTSMGIVCQNVGTAYAISRLARHLEPLTSRIVTVTGAGIEAPRNVQVPIGTPIAELVDFCGGYSSEVARLIHGGSMMGYALSSDKLPVSKATNCLIAASKEEVRRDFTDWPCIRCGECAVACPVRLQPQDLLIASRSNNFSSLGSLGLVDCIECGCCDVVCPSHISLTQSFRKAKALQQVHEQQLSLSADAEQRFRAREERQRETEARIRRQQDTLKQSLDTPAEESTTIAAAVERARQRKVSKRHQD